MESPQCSSARRCASGLYDEGTETRIHNRRDGLSLTTIIVASAASGIAAFVVSRVWGFGTLIGAAVTPIIVALVTELLRHPTEKLPELGVPGRPAPARPRDPSGAQRPPPVHVYRVHDWRRLRIVALTAGAAFVIGVSAYVVLDRVAGGSGRLVPEHRNDAPQPATTTTETVPTTTQMVVTQRTVTVRTVTVPRERTVTQQAPRTQTTSTSPAATQPGSEGPIDAATQTQPPGG